MSETNPQGATPRVDALSRRVDKFPKSDEDRAAWWNKYIELARTLERELTARLSEPAEGVVTVPRDSLSVLCCWWSMVNAGRELDGDPPLQENDVILHYSGNGASCMVTAGQLNAMLDAAQTKG